MPSAAVFSAGGAAGWAYHAGVVAALRDQAGFDASAADLLIGTSAGAATAAAARGGVSPEEMLRPVATPPTPEQRAEMMNHVKSRAKKVRPLSPALTTKAARNRAGWLLATSGLIPGGFFPTAGLGRFPGVADHAEWPAGLYIPAVSVDTAGRVVFGRDVCHVTVADAVEASSAVPGMFEPKEIDGRRFVDGGTLSGTHADLALDADPDFVVISSLITRPGQKPTSRHARKRLNREMADIRSRGVPIVLIQPDEHHRELFRAFPRRGPERLSGILDLAAADVERALLRTEAVIAN